MINIGIGVKVEPDDLEDSSGVTFAQIIELEMEYRLTLGFIAGNWNCYPCLEYFVRRREVLMVAVLEEADKKKVDPADLFSTYVKKVHARHG